PGIATVGRVLVRAGAEDVGIDGTGEDQRIQAGQLGRALGHAHLMERDAVLHLPAGLRHLLRRSAVRIVIGRLSEGAASETQETDCRETLERSHPFPRTGLLDCRPYAAVRIAR